MKSYLGGCGNFIKYSLFVVNLVIFLGGVTVLGLGIWVIAGGQDVKEVLGDKLLTSSSAILLSFGGIVALISFIGCCGAIKEVKCLLLTFFIILVLISILIVVGVIVASKLKDKADDLFVEGIMGTLTQYNNNEVIKEAWDSFQKEMQCCGVKTRDDWIHNSLPIPDSCLRDDKSKSTSKYWDKGCYDALKQEVEKYAKTIIISGAFLAVLIVLSMVFSCALFLML